MAALLSLLFIPLLNPAVDGLDAGFAQVKTKRLNPDDCRAIVNASAALAFGGFKSADSPIEHLKIKSHVAKLLAKILLLLLANQRKTVVECDEISEAMLFFSELVSLFNYPMLV